MHNIQEEFEVKRLDFLKAFKRQKTINMVVLVAALAAAVLLFIAFPNNAEITIAGAVVIMVGLFAYTQITKKSLNKRTYAYINYFYEVTSKLALNHAGIEEYKQFNNLEINREDVEKAKIMKDISLVKSRCDIQFDFANKSIKMSDTLFKTGTDPKTSKIVFCGKFLQCELEKPAETRVIVYRKPKGEFAGPSDLEGLTNVKDDEKIVVYAENDTALNKYKKLISIVSKFEIDEYLLDLTVSVVDDVLSIAMSYADTVMVVPLYDEMSQKPFEKYAKDLQEVLQIIEIL